MVIRLSWGVRFFGVIAITIGSCLFRTESRGHHNRTDYPETDDQNWRCHTIVKQESDKPVYAKRDVIYTRMKPEN